MVNTVKIASVVNRDGFTVRIPLYPLPGVISMLSREDTPLEINEHPKEIYLSVEDICQMAKALKSEMAINDNLEPTPHAQRIHLTLRNS